MKNPLLPQTKALRAHDVVRGRFPVSRGSRVERGVDGLKARVKLWLAGAKGLFAEVRGDLERLSKKGADGSRCVRAGAEWVNAEASALEAAGEPMTELQRLVLVRSVAAAMFVGLQRVSLAACDTARGPWREARAVVPATSAALVEIQFANFETELARFDGRVWITAENLEVTARVMLWRSVGGQRVRMRAARMEVRS